MQDFRMTTKEELLANTKIPLELVETGEDIWYEMAHAMLDEVVKNNAAGKNTVLIIPVGPVQQYRRFAKLVNAHKIDLSNLWLINMDEYLTDEKQWIDKEHPLSFRGFMQRELYDQLLPECQVPESHRIFPEPGKEGEIEKLIVELGGVDIAFGGVGIRGHIAFNEALDEDDPMSPAEFADLPTRVLALTKETRTINSVTGMGGYIDGIPKWCITVGMRELLAARKIRLYMNREWHRGIIRRICLGEVSGQAPASFLQNHPDAKITIAEYAAEAPMGQLR